MFNGPDDRHVRDAASRLRILAAWLDAHEVYDDELYAAGTDGFDGLNVHIKLEAAARLLPGQSLEFNSDGHAKTQIDGASVTVSLPTPKRRVVEMKPELVA